MERNEMTDEQLVERYVNGDEPAFRSLVERYLAPVYNFVHRYVANEGDASDITQEAFVSVWKNIRRFDQDRQFKTWLFAIAKNAALNWLKRKKPLLFSQFETEAGEGGLAESVVDTTQESDILVSRLDAKHGLSSVLGNIRATYRTVIEMRYAKGYTFKEISKSLGEPLHTVKSRHRRALQALKKLLTN
jgi:RNA polymerase sigma-70 factor (ECF subfamily)